MALDDEGWIFPSMGTGVRARLPSVTGQGEAQGRRGCIKMSLQARVPDSKLFLGRKGTFQKTSHGVRCCRCLLKSQEKDSPDRKNLVHPFLLLYMSGKPTLPQTSPKDRHRGFQASGGGRKGLEGDS